MSYPAAHKHPRFVERRFAEVRLHRMDARAESQCMDLLDAARQSDVEMATCSRCARIVGSRSGPGMVVGTQASQELASTKEPDSRYARRHDEATMTVATRTKMAFSNRPCNEADQRKAGFFKESAAPPLRYCSERP